jgi:hypothetical protein
MGLRRSRKTKDSPTEGEDVTTKPPLALAPDGEEPDAARENAPETSVDDTWVRLGADALWAGVLPDDALGALPDAEDVAPPVPAKRARPAEPEPALHEGPPQARPSGPDVPGAAASRVQEPGSPEFRILSGAKTPEDIRRRFGWKTDVELAEAYEIALQERSRATDSDQAFWDALVEMAVTEAANRPTFGEVNEWEHEHDRREQRLNAKRFQALAKARDAQLRERGPS